MAGFGIFKVVTQILEHPHREILMETPIVELEELTEPETERFLDLVMNPGTISPAKAHTPVHFSYEGRDFQFTHIHDLRRRITFDTHPTRFLRHFLVRYRDALKSLKAGDDESVTSLIRRIDGILGSTFLKDVGVLGQVSTNHNVLRKDPHYREILRAHVALGQLTSRSKANVKAE